MRLINVSCKEKRECFSFSFSSQAARCSRSGLASFRPQVFPLLSFRLMLPPRRIWEQTSIEQLKEKSNFILNRAQLIFQEKKMAHYHCINVHTICWDHWFSCYAYCTSSKRRKAISKRWFSFSIFFLLNGLCLPDHFTLQCLLPLKVSVNMLFIWFSSLVCLWHSAGSCL